MYLEAKATTTPITDAGEFRAVVATYDRDRDGDVIRPGAFAKSISEWREVGRMVPLHWNHQSNAIVGDVDPNEMWESDQGLEINGRIDVDDEAAYGVWKQLKRGRLGFSFGFVTTKSEELPDGGHELIELDLFEVSATPSPANNRTRLLSWKSADRRYAFKDEQGLSYDEVTERMADQELRDKLRQEVAVKVAELEAEEQAEEQAAERQREEVQPGPVIPVTDKPFVTDDGATLRICAAEGCRTYPVTEVGSWRPVHDRRWWCPTHSDQAGPEDHLPEEPTYVRVGLGGVALNPASEEGKRVAAEAERQREEEREHEEQERREAEALREVRERYEQEAMVSVCGIEVPVSNVRINP